MDRVVDTRNEWRTFSCDRAAEDEVDPSRVGAATDAFEGDHLETTIGSANNKGSGLTRELRRAAMRGQNTDDRKHTQMTRSILDVCEKFQLPNVIADAAKQMFSRAKKEGLYQRKKDDLVWAAAFVFVACRSAGFPRSFKEFVMTLGVGKKVLGQCTTALKPLFDQTPSTATASTPENGPEKLISRWCNQLGLPFKVEALSRDVIIGGRELGLTGSRNPNSVAGAAIYFSAKLLEQEVSLKEVSLVSSMTERTVESMFKVFCWEKEKLVKKELVETGKVDFVRLLPPSAKNEDVEMRCVFDGLVVAAA
ncbi:transcription initiation factor IIB [Coprinopsis sp. MPI-PUGE-AT-0042]|nr:transcription initiation factor IIB [Coprinopsis sp. MPI-PUGE-AT-0042]